MITKQVTIHFGAITDSIKKQLGEQGFTAPKEDVEVWQRLSNSVTMLCLHGMIPDCIARTARKKILKAIARKSITKGGK